MTDPDKLPDYSIFYQYTFHNSTPCHSIKFISTTMHPRIKRSKIFAFKQINHISYSHGFFFIICTFKTNWWDIHWCDAFTSLFKHRAYPLYCSIAPFCHNSTLSRTEVLTSETWFPYCFVLLSRGHLFQAITFFLDQQFVHINFLIHLNLELLCTFFSMWA